MDVSINVIAVIILSVLLYCLIAETIPRRTPNIDEIAIAVKASLTV